MCLLSEWIWILLGVIQCEKVTVICLWWFMVECERGAARTFFGSLSFLSFNMWLLLLARAKASKKSLSWLVHTPCNTFHKVKNIWTYINITHNARCLHFLNLLIFCSPDGKPLWAGCGPQAASCCQLLPTHSHFWCRQKVKRLNNKVGPLPCYWNGGQ